MTLPNLVIEGLEDDRELYVAVSYLPYAFEQSDMEIGLLCHLSHEGANRELGVQVKPDGIRIFADDASREMPCTCNITCERSVLMQIIQGEFDATSAITSGKVTWPHNHILNNNII